ncbi:hypothetical protein [Mesorhizobium sp. M1E.F.Ca.ET.041.01.1.1]|uniref:hypothetical protein n=1 Tax=Mesorhizobium sp. M1E.F.Ca.ET.041.01.1.1 TaxID=2496759 RepID=UPI0016734E45|nr:hypothetical protein [Mesorhizobium sp. M1E.F.Ca.ET.041.01.1.1]
MHQIKTQAASVRVDEAEQLRVIEENIDVMAFTMTDLDLIAVPPPNDHSKS